MKGGGVLLALMMSALAGCAGPAGGTPAPSVAPSGLSASAAIPSPSRSPSPTTAPVIAARYEDGLPRSIDGAPVLRGAAALGQAQSATDDSPFLVGGWVTYLPGPVSCPVRLAGDTSWLHDCLRPAFSDVAGADDPTLSAALTFRFALNRLTSGPVVAGVEVHDPRASACGAAAPACDRLMVVERIVWAGDRATDPQPISAGAAQGVLATLQAGSSLTRFGPGSMLADCGPDLAAAQLYLVAPTPRDVPAVTLVQIEPSTAARERALAIAAGTTAALGPAALVCTDWTHTPTASSTTEYRWLAIANVVLLVRTHHRPTAADRAFLDRLTAALERAATPGG